MATATLTILYPEEFTVYDVRVCEMLNGFRGLGEVSKFERVWDGYQEFLRAVLDATPNDLSLRERDQYLWGKSFYLQLVEDVQVGFRKQ